MERSYFGCGLAALCNLCNLRINQFSYADKMAEVRLLKP